MAAQTRDKIIGRPGSDYMVDVIKATGMEYIASNPGSSFRSLQESIINYGGNKKPEFLTCTHEESSVAMAHGYAKAAGKADGHHGARHRRSAARGDGGLQCLVRPGSGDDVRRQFSRRQHAATRRRMVSLRAGSGGDACAISPSGTTSRYRCSISPNR